MWLHKKSIFLAIIGRHRIKKIDFIWKRDKLKKSAAPSHIIVMDSVDTETNFNAFISFL